MMAFPPILQAPAFAWVLAAQEVSDGVGTMGIVYCRRRAAAVRPAPTRPRPPFHRSIDATRCSIEILVLFHFGNGM